MEAKSSTWLSTLQICNTESEGKYRERERWRETYTTVAETDGDRWGEIVRHRWRDREKETYIYS